MATNCDISYGALNLTCKDGISGLKAIYLANYDEYSFVVASGATAGHIMTDLGDLDEVFQYTCR